MLNKFNKKDARLKRTYRFKAVNKRIDGFTLSVFRSLNHIYAYVVDSKNSIVLSLSTLSKVFKEKAGQNHLNKVQEAALVGKTIGEIAIEKGIEKIAFDRRGYKFHGRIKALADGAREAGLNF